MPTFGSFETIGSPHAETQARDHSNTVWRARKVGSKDDQIYAIKVFSSADRRSTASQGEQDLDADPGLEFIETLKQQKKAGEISQRLLVPIHEFGTVPQGAWYATDFYRRGSLKVWVTLRGKVDSAALRNVIGSALQACKLLKETHGRSHGNLKISNVFLGGKSQPLSGTPLLFADPQVVPSRSITNLQGRDRHTVQGMIHDTFEVQDLRAIGEMIWQLVTGRLIESAADYNYPVERSKEWERLGREGEKWRKLCEDLVNPHLSLETINLQILSRQFQPASGANVPWLVISLVAGVCVVGGGAYLIFPKHKATSSSPVAVNNVSTQQTTNPQTASQKPSEVDTNAAEAADKEIKYRMAMTAGQKALDGKNYDEADRQATIAWGLKLGDQAASQLLANAKTGKAKALEVETTVAAAAKADQNYKTALKAGQTALQTKNYDEAITQAEIALGLKPGDGDATKLNQAAAAGKTAVQTAADNERKYATALKAGQTALQAKSYDEAITQAGIALGLKPGDGDATKLNQVAAAGKTAVQTAADNERKYATALKAGQTALQTKNYDGAITQAEIALGLKPGDGDATKLNQVAAAGKTAVQTAADNERKYATALKAGQTALQAKNYDEAITQAGIALGLKPGDGDATKLNQVAAAGKTAVQTAADNERKYATALKAGQTALQTKNYDEAITQAEIALGLKPGDGDATKLNQAAAAGKTAVQTAADNERKYATALKAGQTALQTKNYDEAITQAGIALGLKPGDGDATKLNQAAEIARNQQNFQQLLQAGQSALNQGDRDVAIRSADEACKDNPTDESALKLRADANLLRSLDNRLQDLMKRFDVSAEGNTINPKLSSKNVEPSGIDLGRRGAALNEASDLLKQYKDKAHPGWLTPERQKVLSVIPGKINNWE